MSAQRRRIWALTAACGAALWAAGPAAASEVIVVDGQRAERRNDPFVPARAASDLGREPRAGRAARVRSARRAPRARASVRARSSARSRAAVHRALRRAYRKRRLSRKRYVRYRRSYRRARLVRNRLSGARRLQLAYVVGTLEWIARSRRLGTTRMPALFLQLARNTQYWRRLPYPAPGDRVSFRGSELLFQYYPGRGLQIQPLVNFKKANLMHGACTKGDAPCRPAGLRRLLDELSRIAVRRSRRFIAWEYMFEFGGGAPPWISAMAQATGLQALARGAELLEQPRYLRTARRSLGAFTVAPPAGVRKRGFAGGTHYLHYSFAPGLYVFNSFTQSLMGLYDFSKLTGDGRARRLFQAAEPELRREIPHSDVGDWSRYSYRGRESDRNYHELLREVLQSMCSRRLGATYCTYARKYESYQTDPPRLSLLGPDATAKGRLTRVGFRLSKLSAVEITITKRGRTAFHEIATFRRGTGSFLWRPRSTGTYDVRIGAKELRTGRGLKDRDSGQIEVG